VSNALNGLLLVFYLPFNQSHGQKIIFLCITTSHLFPSKQVAAIHLAPAVGADGFALVLEHLVPAGGTHVCLHGLPTFFVL
jgi:hypothetical protein